MVHTLFFFATLETGTHALPLMHSCPLSADPHLGDCTHTHIEVKTHTTCWALRHSVYHSVKWGFVWILWLFFPAPTFALISLSWHLFSFVLQVCCICPSTGKSSGGAIGKWSRIYKEICALSSGSFLYPMAFNMNYSLSLKKSTKCVSKTWGIYYTYTSQNLVNYPLEKPLAFLYS